MSVCPPIFLSNYNTSGLPNRLNLTKYIIARAPHSPFSQKFQIYLAIWHFTLILHWFYLAWIDRSARTPASTARPRPAGNAIKWACAGDEPAAWWKFRAYTNKPRQDETPGRFETLRWRACVESAWRRREDGARRRATNQDEFTWYVHLTSTRRGFMASARSKRTYMIGWDGCGSLSFRNGRRIMAGRDWHFKTNHRLACPISVLSPQDRQILETASFPQGSSHHALTLEFCMIFYAILFYT